MKLTSIVLSMFAVIALAGCLTETEGDDDSSSDGEDPQWECVPIATCDASDENSTDSEDPEDGTWECIPFVNC
jgi:hypothetical protein